MVDFTAVFKITFCNKIHSLFTAVAEVVKHSLAFVVSWCTHAALHAAESQLIVLAAVILRVFGNIVDALEEVGHLAFTGLRVACSSVGAQTSLIEVFHLRAAYHTKLVSVDKCLKPNILQIWWEYCFISDYLDYLRLVSWKSLHLFIYNKL